jgi:hypothetical protein
VALGIFNGLIVAVGLAFGILLGLIVGVAVGLGIFGVGLALNCVIDGDGLILGGNFTVAAGLEAGVGEGFRTG